MSIKLLGNIGVIRVQTLHAIVVPACKCCGAPGTFHDVPDVNVGCFNPSRKGQSVGSVCPNCGEDRPGDDMRGEIWRKEWTVWQLLSDRIKALFRRTA